VDTADRELSIQTTPTITLPSDLLNFPRKQNKQTMSQRSTWWTVKSPSKKIQSQPPPEVRLQEMQEEEDLDYIPSAEFDEDGRLVGPTDWDDCWPSYSVIPAPTAEAVESEEESISEPDEAEEEIEGPSALWQELYGWNPLTRETSGGRIVVTEFPWLERIKSNHYMFAEPDAGEKDSGGDRYLAQVGDCPYSSENHIAQTKIYEVLVGGMPQRKGRKKGREKIGGRRRTAAHTVLRTRGPITAAEARALLTYRAGGKITNSGAVLAAQRWKTNDAYDVDPIFSATDTSGYSAWAGLYGYFRVLGYLTILEFYNRESFPVTIFIITSNTDPGTVGTDYGAYSTNPYGKSFVLGPNGTTSAFKKVTCKHSIVQVVGSKAPLTDDSFRAPTNASPADVTWFGVGIDTVDGSLLTGAGVRYEIRHSMMVHFYGRKLQTV
jgi:hypothetical protein